MNRFVLALLLLASLPALAETKITTNVITDGAVTTPKLAADSVTAGKIVDGAVGTAEVDTDALTSADLAANSVGTSEIADGTVAAVDLNAILDLSSKTLTLPFGSMWTYGPQLALTGLATLDLSTTVPAGVTEIEVVLSGLSHATAAAFTSVQVGDAGGVETVGYVSHAQALDGATVAEGTSTSGYVLGTANWNAANGYSGVARFVRWDATEFLWIGEGRFSDGGLQTVMSGGKATSEVVTTVRIVSSAGNWDAGEARVRYR